MVTIGTKVRSVIYQHLFAQICILEQDTIGYKRYNFVRNDQKASNTNKIRDARIWFAFLNSKIIERGIYLDYAQKEEIKIQTR